MSVTVESTFCVEDIIRTTQVHGGRTEPKADELITKLRKLQQAKRILEEEVSEALSRRKSLQEEEAALSAEALQLKRTLKEREESCRVLQFKCEELQQESQRQREQNQQKEELVQQCSCQIQETKLRHRKIRIKFENQLQQLMDQHKHLHSTFDVDKLPAEVLHAEHTTAQLLKAEQQKLDQLAQLEKLSSTPGAVKQTETDVHPDPQ